MKKIYVGNLSFKTTEEELRGAFAAHGQVDSVSMITDAGTGRPRGFAFVEMSNDGDAEKAIAALNGMDLGGRQLNVNEARPQRDRGERGGRRGGFGGGRGDGGGEHRGHARKPREPRW